MADIKFGSLITNKNIRSIHPGYELTPSDLQKLIVYFSSIDTKKVAALGWVLIKPKKGQNR
jgi:hypothetical protein